MKSYFILQNQTIAFSSDYQSNHTFARDGSRLLRVWNGILIPLTPNAFVGYSRTTMEQYRHNPEYPRWSWMYPYENFRFSDPFEYVLFRFDNTVEYVKGESIISNNRPDLSIRREVYPLSQQLAFGVAVGGTPCEQKALKLSMMLSDQETPPLFYFGRAFPIQRHIDIYPVYKIIDALDEEAFRYFISVTNGEVNVFEAISKTMAKDRDGSLQIPAEKIAVHHLYTPPVFGSELHKENREKEAKKQAAIEKGKQTRARNAAEKAKLAKKTPARKTATKTTPIKKEDTK